MSIVRDYTDLVYENYDMFLKEHDEFFKTSGSAMSMLASEGSFNAFVGGLTSGMSKDSKYAVETVLKRERQMLLQEAVGQGQIASTAAAIGYAVSYFPILADIYSDPVISQIATVYPVNKSIITIPKVTLQASYMKKDGSMSTPVRMPRTENLIRQEALNVTLNVNAPTNLFSAVGTTNYFDEVKNRVNKRYFMINSVTFSQTLTGPELAALDAATGTSNANPVVWNVPVMIRPDARGQLKDTFSFQSKTVTPITCTANLYGNIDFDTGVVTYTLTITAPGATIALTGVNASVIFSPKTSDVGRVKVSLKMEGFDVDVD
ncbi:MAG: hypothetical protein H7836_04725 [Magnetococcus sp. YQC-3]